MIKPDITQFDLIDIKDQFDWDNNLNKTKLKVLFVTDGRFTDTNSVYQYMDGSSIGCTKFEVDRAQYSYNAVGTTYKKNPRPNEPHYRNFKFQSKKPNGNGRIIDQYSVIFLFAVSSGADNLICDEIRELSKWMNSGGGLFATGDHSILGQRLGSRIPRVKSMRKWTLDDGVPPGTGGNRIDTNQADPTIPGQVNGTEIVMGFVESDRYPQPISWIPVRSERISYFQRVEYPHEVLCHPTLGAINVMPDHPHEGECREPNSIDYNATYENNLSEYPTKNGHQEQPVVIAKGRNSTEFKHQKDIGGKLKDKVFSMISVYDGHQSGVGRVAVDSTWHHWYGMNINQIQSAGGNNWSKIGRYYLNLAKYLAPENFKVDRCWLDLINLQFEDPFLEEYTLLEPNLGTPEIGYLFGNTLRRRWGACGEVEFVIASLCEINPSFCERVVTKIVPPWSDPRGPDCLSCPPFDLIKATVLGGMVEGTVEYRRQLKSVFFDGRTIKGRISAKRIRKSAMQGAERSVVMLMKKLKVQNKEFFSGLK